MKLLGYHFDGNPSPRAHVQAILKKVRYRTWTIYNLKRLGMCAAGLVNVYTVLIRPCFDYACIVYGPMLTRTQSDQLERQQRKIMKIIYGWEESYDRALARAGIDDLLVRRNALTERFALKLERNERFASWFPVLAESGYPLRASQKYLELPFRTERLRDAPIYRYRRVLNRLHEESRE